MEVTVAVVDAIAIEVAGSVSVGVRIEPLPLQLLPTSLMSSSSMMMAIVNDTMTMMLGSGVLVLRFAVAVLLGSMVHHR